MVQEYDLKGLKKERRKKRFRRFIKKIIIFTILIILTGIVYCTRDSWLPVLDNIAMQYLNSSSGSDKESNEDFPLQLSESSEYMIESVDSCLAVVDDSHASIYSQNGMEIFKFQHNYSNPVMKVNSKKVLLYDSGGKQYALLSKYKTQYQKTLSSSIIFARISSNDCVVVVTGSEEYLCEMNVYDKNGKVIYTWKCSAGRIIDVAFTPMNEGCIVTTVDTKGGQMVCNIYKFRFSNKDYEWCSSVYDTIVVNTHIFNDGTIVALGDNKCAYYSKDGKAIGEYNYPNELKNYSYGDETLSLLLKSDEKREIYLYIITDINKDPQRILLEDGGYGIVADKNGNTYVLTEKGITEYSPQGNEIACVVLNNKYMNFCKMGNYVYLLGEKEIDRIKFMG